MQQCIGIAMADGFPIVGNIDPAQSQRSTGPKPVRVVSDSNPHSVRGLGLLMLIPAGFVNVGDYTERGWKAEGGKRRGRPCGCPPSFFVLPPSPLRLPPFLSLPPALGGTYNDFPMAIIEIEALAKSYQVYQKKEGLAAAVGGLFRRRYRLVEAVRGIDLRVEQGEFVAFLGPNGAGKTTTLKLLSGVISPSSGIARVMGFVPWRRENAYRRRFALVMGQKNQLWWDLPAAESFRLHQQIYRIEPDRFDRTHDELTDLLGVRGLLGQPVRELSLGERMKMELIAALLHSPEVLFLDEPTIGLDVVAQHNIQAFLKHYQQARKVTILLTSHYMKDIVALCRRVVIIASGRIIYDGSLSGILDRFGGHKIISLQMLNGEMPANLDRYGALLTSEPPQIKLRVERSVVPEILSKILANHSVVDVSVEDPPIEEVIAEMFLQTNAELTTDN